MMPKLRFSSVLAFGFIAGCSPVTSSEGEALVQIFVDSSGQPSEQPYDLFVEDINEAADHASRFLKSGAKVEVILSDGIHYMDEPLVLGSEYSGQAEAPFTIKALNPRQAILSGAAPAEVKWQKHTDKIWVAEIANSGFDAVFVDGKRQIRARYPNYDPEIRPYAGYAKDAIAPERIKTWSNPETGIFHALHSGRWGGWHYDILGRNEDGTLKLSEGTGNNRPSEPHETYRYVENIFEELDAPGEWYFDAKTGHVYLYPRDGVDLNASGFSVSSHENLIELRGTPESPVSHVLIDGLVFQGTKMTFEKTTEPLLRSDWMIHRGGSIVFEGTKNSYVTNSEFKALGGNAVFFSGYNRSSGARGNLIADVGGSGVSVVGKSTAVRSPSFTYTEFVSIEDMDFELGPKSEEYPSDIIVEDNLITNVGTVEKQVAGVQISMAQRVMVINNSIYNVPRAGINIGDGTWGGHLLKGNDVFHTVLETGDHGAFNSWGRDRFWHPEWDTIAQIAKDYPELILADAIEPVVIEGNRWQSDHGWDIDLDDGSSNYIIRNNVCLSGGLKLREGFSRTVENNIMLNNSFHPHVWFENSNDVFRHNIIMTDYKDIRVDDWGDNINYNMFPTKTSLMQAQSLGLDSNSVYGDVEFLDADKGDYRVKEGSLAKKIGFKNFEMSFGVKSAWLRDKAETPEIPELFLNANIKDANEVVDFLGTKVRSVVTEGDKSAYGLASVSGVIVESVTLDSLAVRGGLQPDDVIIGAFDEWKDTVEIISDISSLRSSYQARRWMGQLSFVIMRNQQKERITISLTE